MSSAERFVRHHKRQTDQAISQAYARLAPNAVAAATFDELLECVRRRAPRVLDAPAVNGHPGVEALVNLSRFRSAHLRSAADWSGTSATWRPAVCSLARHLVCRYGVPAFLAASWYATDDTFAERTREWYVAHARGASFRSLDLPIAMTRRMEHIFLASPDHLSVEHAMRRSELLALGAPGDLAGAVLAIPLDLNWRDAAFWRTVWRFMISNARDMDPAHVGPMIDFIHAIRHQRMAVDTPNGVVLRDPPQPSFSMKGRTVQSMVRLMQQWHRSLGVKKGSLTWEPSPLRPMILEEPSQEPAVPPAVWQLIELTSGEQLRKEGSALRHCVASYAERCWRGASRIWSLRVQRGEYVQHVLTIEIDMRQRAVVQARGWRNRAASGKPLELLEEWTMRERLRLAI